MFFTEQEKKIYSSPTGRKYDPVDLYNKIVASSPNLNEILYSWWGEQSTDSERAQAALQLTQIARNAFEMPPIDQEGGVASAIVLETLYDFLRWREGKD